MIVALLPFALGSLGRQRMTHKVVFGVAIDGVDVGDIEIGLFGEVVPKTVQNFVELANREEGEGYVGSMFHRIIPGFMIQGGDFTHHDGRGGESIYGRRFQNQNYLLKHEALSVSLVNEGNKYGGSQFFITVVNAPWLDGKHVVLGRVVRGEDVVLKVDSAGSASGRPWKQVKIVRSRGFSLF